MVKTAALSYVPFQIKSRVDLVTLSLLFPGIEQSNGSLLHLSPNQRSKYLAVVAHGPVQLTDWCQIWSQFTKMHHYTPLVKQRVLQLDSHSHSLSRLEEYEKLFFQVIITVLKQCPF